MSHKTKDRTGLRYGRLVVVRLIGEKNKKVYWECCCDCGTLVVVSGANLQSGATKSCGCLKKELLKAQVGEKSRFWRGGSFIGKNGYKSLFLPDHPRARKAGRNGARYVFEHLVIMEEKLGRSLTKGETVHHINGIRDDNRPDNLELWVSSHPSGQRVSDLVEWAKEILSRYEPTALSKALVLSEDLQ